MPVCLVQHKENLLCCEHRLKTLYLPDVSLEKLQPLQEPMIRICLGGLASKVCLKVARLFCYRLHMQIVTYNQDDN